MAPHCDHINLVHLIGPEALLIGSVGGNFQKVFFVSYSPSNTLPGRLRFNVSSSLYTCRKKSKKISLTQLLLYVKFTPVLMICRRCIALSSLNGSMTLIYPTPVIMKDYCYIKRIQTRLPVKGLK